MSIFDNLFGKGATPPAAQVSKETPQGTNTPDNQQQQQQNSDQQKQTEVSPLDQFKDLWQPPENAADANKSNDVFGNVDPKKLMEAAGKIDFSKAINPAQLEAINAGGPEAMKAMMAVMNQMSQQAYAQSAFASTQIVNEALKKARGSLDNDLPAMVRKLQAGETLLNENPVFKNPAVQPIMEVLKEQMAAKFPNASSAELAKMSKDFILALSGSVNETQQQTQKKTEEQPSTDFSEYFNSTFNR